MCLFDSLVWGATQATLEVEKYESEPKIAYLQENVSRILCLSNNRLCRKITAWFQTGCNGKLNPGSGQDVLSQSSK